MHQIINLLITNYIVLKYNFIKRIFILNSNDVSHSFNFIFSSYSHTHNAHNVQANDVLHILP